MLFASPIKHFFHHVSFLVPSGYIPGMLRKALIISYSTRQLSLRSTWLQFPAIFQIPNTMVPSSTVIRDILSPCSDVIINEIGRNDGIIAQDESFPGEL